MAEQQCVVCARHLPEGPFEDEVTFCCDPFACDVSSICDKQWRCGRCVEVSAAEI